MITFLSLLVALCTGVAWRCQVRATLCQLSSWNVTNLCSFRSLGSHQCSKSHSRLLQRCLASQFSVPYFVLLKDPTTTGFLTFAVLEMLFSRRLLFLSCNKQIHNLVVFKKKYSFLVSHASQVDSIDLQKNKYVTAAYFVQNYLEIEGNLKIIVN